jgi:hypothetical protein
MSSRYERRLFKAEAARELVTYLVEPSDPRLDSMPLPKNAARHWLTALKHRVRHCAVCNTWVVDEHDVGALLLGVATRANSVGWSASVRQHQRGNPMMIRCRSRDDHVDDDKVVTHVKPS